MHRSVLGLVLVSLSASPARFRARPARSTRARLRPTAGQRTRPTARRRTAARHRTALAAHAGDRAARVAGCRRVAEAQVPELDLTSEIDAVTTLGLGDTVVVEDGGEVVGFAVCHAGANTEAGSGPCYVKSAAVRPGEGAPRRFETLVDACMAFAASRGAKVLLAGVNTARHEAYRRLLARGFRSVMQGVTMHRPNAPAYDRPDRFVIDDLR